MASEDVRLRLGRVGCAEEIWAGFEGEMGRLMSGGEEVVFLGEAGVLRDG